MINQQPIHTIDLTNILDHYANKWVALSANQTHVIGSGMSLKEALDQAKQSGQRDPVVMFVPGISGPHVLVHEVPIYQA